MNMRIFASLLAGALVLPQTAYGSEPARSRSDSFGLPPIPHAETIPWLAYTSQPNLQLSKLGVILKAATLDFRHVQIAPPIAADGSMPYLITRPASLNGKQ